MELDESKIIDIECDHIRTKEIKKNNIQRFGNLRRQALYLY